MLSLDDRKVSTMIYVLGLMGIAKRRGFMTGGPDVTQKGWRMFQQLTEKKFLPTDFEMKGAARAVLTDKTDSNVDMVCALLRKVGEEENEWPEIL